MPTPEGELILDLLEEPIEQPGPLSRPERYVSEFKKRAAEALNGGEVAPEEFVKDPKFVEARTVLEKRAGSQPWTTRVIEQWFYENRNRFKKQKNVQ